MYGKISFKISVTYYKRGGVLNELRHFNLWAKKRGGGCKGMGKGKGKEKKMEKGNGKK